jgi:hypothetical protein
VFLPLLAFLVIEFTASDKVLGGLRVFCGCGHERFEQGFEVVVQAKFFTLLLEQSLGISSHLECVSQMTTAGAIEHG